MMKMLVGAACCAIIAASGVYLSGEYSAHAAEIAAVAASKESAAAKYKAQIADDMEHTTGQACMRIARPAVVLYEAGQGASDYTKRRLSLCIKSGELWPWDRDELKRVGLYDDLASR